MAGHFPTVVVTGTRQTDKTTLLTKLFGNYERSVISYQKQKDALTYH